MLITNARADTDDPVMEVTNLTIAAATVAGVVDVVDDVSLILRRGQITALAGESGSGKSVTSLALLRLHDPETLRIRSGRVLLGGSEVTDTPADQLRRVRGSMVSMVFQEPMNSIDPMYSVGDSIIEVIRAHNTCTRAEAARRAETLFERVGIPDAKNRLSAYPFELSGGLLQRVMIAMAIANDPAVLIADEPTTALDVTVQKQIMQLLRSLADEGMSILLVTHDLAVVSEYADVLNVMYAGQIVESGSVHTVLRSPSHPYTAGLIGAIPDVSERKPELMTIPGRVPLPQDFPEACRFIARCPFAAAECDVPITLTRLPDERSVRCIRHDELELKGVVAHG